MGYLTKLFCILSFSVASTFCQSNSTWTSSIDKESKQFSLFSIVTFKNAECDAISTAGLKGVCMTTTECQGTGTSDGNCAASFGVCCVIRVSVCGGIASSNSTYIENPSYPSAFKTTGDCSYTVTRVQTDICQIRLDFFSVVLQQPTSTTGSCTNTILTSTQGSTGVTFQNTPPALCGTLTGQHLYMDAGTANTAATLKFTIATALDNTWRIKVSQIECWNPSRAPQGCLQYFTGLRTTFSSFNWDGTAACSTGCFLNNQQYSVCFRPEKGMCAMSFAQTEVSSTIDSFHLNDGLENAAQTSALCIQTAKDGHLRIRNDVVLSADLFCSHLLAHATLDGTAIPTSILASPGVIYAKESSPWSVQVFSLATQNALAGLSVDANQVPCV